MMERPEFEQLQREVQTPVTMGEDPKTKLGRIRQQLADSVKSGALQIVDREEVNLVAEFRIWKASPQVASGIFHYKRKERHDESV